MRQFNGNSRGKFSGRRDSSRASRRGSGRGGRESRERTMHEVTCDKCGEICEVPFKPTAGKPVYCSDCFRKSEGTEQDHKPFDRESIRRGRRESGRFDRREKRMDFSDKVMHEVTCDKCGEICEVPFKPTAGKPVYCSDCFENKEKTESRSKSVKSSKELDEINRKLDKIMKALDLD